LYLTCLAVEFAYCSNRGICDFSVGDCKCSSGFGGKSCSIATYLHYHDDNEQSALQISAPRYDFQSTLMRLNSAAQSTNFSFFETVAAGEVTCSLRGDGYLQVNELRTLTGGETIQNGGLYVSNEGISVYNDGLIAYSDRTDAPVMSLTNAYTGPLGSAYSVLRINSMTTSPSIARAIVVKDRDSVCSEVSADGALRILQSGLSITGGLTVMSLGLVTTGGLSVNTGGVIVRSGGVSMTGGATVYGGGLAILKGGLQVTTGITVNSGGLYIGTGGSTVQGGLVLPNSDLKVNSGGLVLTGGISLQRNGLYVTQNGVSVRSGGAFVRLVGMTVSSGGLTCTGPVTIVKGSLFVTSGLSVIASGINILGGGMTIIDGGLKVAQGLTIQSDGLKMTGGITVRSQGVRSTGGLSVSDLGMYVVGGVSIGTGGLVVNNGGIYLTDAWIGNGMAVSGDKGLFVNSLFESKNSVYNFGVTGNSVFSSVTVVRSAAFRTGGNVYVAGSLTVVGSTNLQSSARVYSDRQLKTNLLPITGALDKVSRLQGVYFDWIKNEKSGLEFDEKRHVGVIAQNVLDVLPEAVDRKDGGNYLGVDYSAMVPLLGCGLLSHGPSTDRGDS
jgi:fibronectin-binding autotransporter adhesin